MEVIIGKTAGFCYGVKRAVDGAKEKLENKKEILYCLGEIVHNKQVIEELQREGMIFVDDMKDVHNKLVIRAHGIKKEIYKEAESRGIELIDYTCPNVIKIHEIADKYSKNDYYILLCGNKNHPENIGTMSYCGHNFFVIEDIVDTYKAIEELKKLGKKKVLLISQTTYSIDSFYRIEEILKKELVDNIELIVKNTICKATEIRQKETEEISKKVDYMIIIGGKNSSNTKKLYNISKKNCKNCILIESSEQIDYEVLRDKKTVGIMAGASTPKKNIQEVYERLVNL